MQRKALSKQKNTFVGETVMKDLLYTIGELLATELDEETEITYPREYGENELKITIAGGKTYRLTLTEE